MAAKKNETEANVEKNSALPALSESELAQARREGAKQDVQEAAKDQHRFLTDMGIPGEPSRLINITDETTPLAPLLDLNEDALQARFDPKSDAPLGEEKVGALLALERAGKNRTSYVQLLCKQLGVKSPYEVTSAGPPYTNDTTNITEISR